MRAGGRGIEARLLGNFAQRRDLANGSAVEKISGEEPFHHVGSIAAALLRPRDQPVGVARIRLAHDAVERKVDADGIARAANTIVDGRRARRAAELRGEIAFPINAGGGQVGIELERAPAYLGGEQWLVHCQPGERFFEPALADEAPWAHDIGKHFDLESGGFCDDGHERSGRSLMLHYPRHRRKGSSRAA